MSDKIVRRGEKELESINKFIKSGDYNSAIRTADQYLATIVRPGYNIEKKELGYYFANYEEFALFIEMSRDEFEDKKSEIESIIMMDGLASEILQMKAYALFEMKKHEEAIEVLVHALTEFNPVGRDIRFELVENYFNLHQLDLAEKELLILRGLVMSKEAIAHLYRRLGFCKIEQGEHIAARVCLQYSLWFEKSEMAVHEIAYIDNLAGEPWNDDNYKEKLDWLLSGIGMGMCAGLAHEMNLQFTPTPYQFACALSFLKLYEKNSEHAEMAEKYFSLLCLWKEIMEISEIEDKTDEKPLQ